MSETESTIHRTVHTHVISSPNVGSRLMFRSYEVDLDKALPWTGITPAGERITIHRIGGMEEIMASIDHTPRSAFKAFLFPKTEMEALVILPEKP